VISDHLDCQDARQLLTVLQTKINTYLSFLENGEIYEKHPETKGSLMVIEVLFHCQPSLQGRACLANPKLVVEKAGYGFRHRLVAATPYTN